MRGLINGIYVGVPWPREQSLQEIEYYNWFANCRRLASTVAQFEKKNISDECESVIHFTDHAQFDQNNCHILILDDHE